MYIKVFPHGKGNGKSPTHYLIRLDYPNRKENPPVVLRGDVDKTQQIIDRLSRNGNLQLVFCPGIPMM